MSKFPLTLTSTRHSLGHKNAKSFYDFLKDRGLECNYQYYVKIEKGSVFPSAQIINQIAKALPRKAAEALVSSFCSDQFQSFDYLFPSSSAEDVKSTKDPVGSALQGQKELTLRQIAALAKRKENYFLFLLLTLSRKPLTKEELGRFPRLEKASVELREVDLTFNEKGLLQSTSTEFRFPKALDEATKRAYGQFDEWDRDFADEFGLEVLLNKMMIRRISPRYFSVILKQIDAFTDFVRCSDESDKRHNSDVLHLQIKISKGELPG